MLYIPTYLIAVIVLALAALYAGARDCSDCQTISSCGVLLFFFTAWPITLYVKSGDCLLLVKEDLFRSLSM